MGHEHGQIRAEVYEDVAGEWRWRAIAANNEIVAISGEGDGYTRKEDAYRALRNNGSPDWYIEEEAELE